MTTPEPFGKRPLRFKLWDQVCHRTAPAATGMITAFMQRGQNYSYEVSWGIDKCVWHMEEELELVEDQPDIGFLPEPD